MAGKATTIKNYDPEILGSNITKARKDHNNMKKTELCDRTGISYNALCNIENGTTNPKMDTIIGIAIQLGTSIPELLKGALL